MSPEGPCPQEGNHKRFLLFLLLSALLTVAAYHFAPSTSFQYDDKVEITGNRTIRDVSKLKDIFQYNPARFILILTFALNYDQYGFDPYYYHIVNILIHYVNSIVLYILISIFVNIGAGRRPPRVELLPFYSGLLFVIHPIFVEGVTYISARSSSLSTLFLLLALLSFMNIHRFLHQDRPLAGKAVRVAPLYIISFALFLTGLFTKETAAVFPLLLLAVDLLLMQGARKGIWRRFLFLYLPFFMVVLAGTYVRLVLYFQGETSSLLNKTPYQYLLTQINVLVKYILLSLFPIRQTVYHDFPLTRTIDLRTTLSLAILLAILLFTLSGVRKGREPLLPLSILFFFFPLLPTSSFIPLKENMVEHRIYASGAGLTLFISIALFRLSAPLFRGKGPFLKACGWGILLLVPLLYLYKTVTYNRIWKDEKTLWSHAVAISPHSADAHYALGDALRLSRSYDAAISSYERAVSLRPDFTEAYINLGITWGEKRKWEKAAHWFREAARNAPDYFKVYNNLGALYFKMKDYRRAVVYFERAIRCYDNWLALKKGRKTPFGIRTGDVKKGNILAHWSLGNIYYEFIRNSEKAIYHYEKVLEIDPTFSYAEEVRRRLLELTW